MRAGRSLWNAAGPFCPLSESASLQLALRRGPSCCSPTRGCEPGRPPALPLDAGQLASPLRLTRADGLQQTPSSSPRGLNGVPPAPHPHPSPRPGPHRDAARTKPRFFAGSFRPAPRRRPLRVRPPTRSGAPPPWVPGPPSHTPEGPEPGKAQGICQNRPRPIPGISLGFSQALVQAPSPAPCLPANVKMDKFGGDSA